MRTTAPARECNRLDCDVRIVLAMRADTKKWVPYEAETREGDARIRCHVLVGDQAWKPLDLAAQFQVAFQLSSLEEARELVNDYPHHRPHLHLDTPPTTSSTDSSTATEGDTHP